MRCVELRFNDGFLWTTFSNKYLSFENYVSLCIMHTLGFLMQDSLDSNFTIVLLQEDSAFFSFQVYTSYLMYKCFLRNHILLSNVMKCCGVVRIVCFNAIRFFLDINRVWSMVNCKKIITVSFIEWMRNANGNLIQCNKVDLQSSKLLNAIHATS